MSITTFNLQGQGDFSWGSDMPYGVDRAPATSPSPSKYGFSCSMPGVLAGYMDRG